MIKLKAFILILISILSISACAQQANLPIQIPFTLKKDGFVTLVSKDGNYELSVPLSVLGLKPAAGLSVKGDIGILRGDGTRTISRNYWNNKATGIVSDVPSEADLTPNLWGIFKFVAP